MSLRGGRGRQRKWHKQGETFWPTAPALAPDSKPRKNTENMSNMANLGIHENQEHGENMENMENLDLFFF